MTHGGYNLSKCARWSEAFSECPIPISGMTGRKIQEVSPETELSYGPMLKRLKVSHASPLDTLQPTSSRNPIKASHFANDLFDKDNIALLNSDYISNIPFKYGVVEKLFQDDLLKQVKDECLSELNFAEKETDIYKVLTYLLVPKVSFF